MKATRRTSAIAGGLSTKLLNEELAKAVNDWINR